MVVIQAATRGSVVPLQTRATSPITETHVVRVARQLIYNLHSLLNTTVFNLSQSTDFPASSSSLSSSQSTSNNHFEISTGGQLKLRRHVSTSAPRHTVSQQLRSHRRTAGITISSIAYQTTKMLTRRSARLSTASDLKSSSASAPPPPPPPPQPAKRGRKRKADAEEPAQPVVNGNVSEAAPAPTTPSKRRAPKKSAVAAAAAPPATPTPSSAKLIAEPAGSRGAPTTPKPRPAAVSRLADPNATNALLLSPETSRVVASSRAAAVRDNMAATATTTTTLLEEANRHLISVDARMRPLVEQNYCRIFAPEGLAEKVDPFESLCSGIISQQVSGAAAKSIKKRFVELFLGEEKKMKKTEEVEEGETTTSPPFPHPSQVSACSIERLRTAGLSQRKAEYVQGLAEKFVSGALSAEMLADAPYEEVVERLTAVRGLGRWSVEMFACFGLKRMDVFSLGDLGVQRGMAAFEGRDVARLKSKGGKFKYMSEREMEEIAARFAPYRSLFMWYMWRVEATDVSTLE
ncbi:DNA glycosylase [Biscogniauxia mediterranea]|nr:DNA glycosylase [Biscogniauxia mediterranea]